MTTGAMTLDERCEALMEAYPLAVEYGSTNSLGRCLIITLVMPGPEFVQIWRPAKGGPWRVAAVDPVDGDVFERAVTTGVPIPCDGFMFGYAVGERITALIYTWTEMEDPGPCYSVIVRVGDAGDLWPLFTGDPFGSWFWDLYRQGRIINLGPAVARTRGAVFWADSVAEIGSGCTLVTRDVEAGDAVIPSGVWVHNSQYAAGVTIPSAEELLARDDLTDLGPRFREDA